MIPLPFAIELAYLALVGLVGGVGYLFVINATTELAAITEKSARLLSAASAGTPTLLVEPLEQFGLSQQQIHDLTQRAAEQLQRVAENALPPAWQRVASVTLSLPAVSSS
jgi:hypothetical protein